MYELLAGKHAFLQPRMMAIFSLTKVGSVAKEGGWGRDWSSHLAIQVSQWDHETLSSGMVKWKI